MKEYTYKIHLKKKVLKNKVLALNQRMVWQLVTQKVDQLEGLGIKVKKVSVNTFFPKKP
ncbi:MAG: hypothetical protein U0X91_20855 [Spirosomataceae bacterium]